MCNYMIWDEVRWYDITWHGILQNDMTWLAVIRYEMMWFDIISFHMIWLDMIGHSSISHLWLYLLSDITGHQESDAWLFRSSFWITISLSVYLSLCLYLSLSLSLSIYLSLLSLSLYLHLSHNQSSILYHHLCHCRVVIERLPLVASKVRKVYYSTVQCSIIYWSLNCS